MERAIGAASIVRPAWRSEGRQRTGPDEDALTLTVAAAEALELGDVPGSLHVVGLLEEAQDWAVREALGAPHLQIHHRPPGPSSLFAALADAARVPEKPGAAVVVALRSRSDGASAPSSGHVQSWGEGSIAFALSESGGLEVLGDSHRGHPGWKVPEAAEWVRAAGRAVGGDVASLQGRLCLVSREAPPVLIIHWKRAAPGMEVEPLNDPDPAIGMEETLGAARALERLARGLSAGAVGILAWVGPERTAFLGVRAARPVEWKGPWTSAEAGRPSSVATAPEHVEAVSEGAYVPRATYLTNLPSRWRLAADRCPACAAVTFPARGLCRHCGVTEKLERFELPRRGLPVVAVTTVAPGAQPTEFDDPVRETGAYDVVLAEPLPQVRATLQATDGPGRSLKIGDRIDTVLRRLYPMEGEWRYGLKAIPAQRGRPDP